MDYMTSFKEKWINDKLDEDAIKYLSGFGAYLCELREDRNGQMRAGSNAVTTSQIRNIFSEVKRLEIKMSAIPREDNDDPKIGEWESDILMLRPKIAYSTARTLQRTPGSRMKDLRAVLEKALAPITHVRHFGNFSKFFEAIIAYHKVNGGKD